MDKYSKWLDKLMKKTQLGAWQETGLAQDCGGEEHNE